MSRPLHIYTLGSSGGEERQGKTHGMPSSSTSIRLLRVNDLPNRKKFNQTIAFLPVPNLLSVPSLDYE
jgi:hypothetical protein